MLTLYKFNWNCGRSGELDGLFIAESDEIDKLIGKTIYFGEVLGKHSDIFAPLATEDLTVMSNDQVFIAQFVEIMGTGTISGFNPLDFYEPEDDEEE